MVLGDMFTYSSRMVYRVTIKILCKKHMWFDFLYHHLDIKAGITVMAIEKIPSASPLSNSVLFAIKGHNFTCFCHSGRSCVINFIAVPGHGIQEDCVWK